jgi:hypothetical protein
MDSIYLKNDEEYIGGWVSTEEELNRELEAHSIHTGTLYVSWYVFMGIRAVK